MIDLTLKNSTSNTELKTLIGNEKFEELKEELCVEYNNTCQCCGWKPKVEEGEDEGQFEFKKNHLVLHVEKLVEDNPSFSKNTLLCRSCYAINHIDVALEYKMVELVNARVTQQDLIKICWSDVSKGQLLGENRSNAEQDMLYIKLKGDKDDYLEKIKSGALSKTLKVIFTDSFLKKI
jgi:hypothetical protein